MVKYKAIFFDMDGTLTNFDTHQVPQSAREALELAKANGVRLFLATGRHPLFFQEDSPVHVLPFDAHLTANGQFCYSGDEVIHRKHICREDKDALCALLERRPIPLLFMAEKEICVNMGGPEVERGNKALRAPPLRMRESSHCLGLDLLALLLYGGRENEELLLSATSHCQAVRWHPDFVDVIPADGGKHSGMDAILAHYGIALEETMAFGDAQNDLSMLEHAGLGVAMGNAADEVKAAADDVTAAVEEDGIWRALKKWQVI